MQVATFRAGMAIGAVITLTLSASASPRDAAQSLFRAIASDRSHNTHELIDYAMPEHLLRLPGSIDEIETLSQQMEISAFRALAERTHLVEELDSVTAQEDEALRSRLTAIERSAPGSLQRLQEIVSEFEDGGGSWKLGLEAERIYRGHLQIVRRHLNDAFAAVAKHEDHTPCEAAKTAAQLEIKRVEIIANILSANHVLKNAAE